MINYDVKVLLDDLYLSSEGDELEFIKKEFENIAKAIAHFDKIDVTNVEGSTWPFKIYNNYLREDVISHSMSNEDTLKNAKQVQDGYVKYVKVV
ncbi:MAG: Asp-tRNA(Asn)/Glu-tRNA(Gln) amidotransferase GatCAB subunit C [Bacilli bacterium]|jgi:aspartyl/glutamyl-tRNA(Asn/Gln) amidotransferase C subunit|nr:Asp-tRNA(Asn)/Glu-tRNA(Gln) amidotransferase GatCAB subunit C [Bacilli bacterium]